MSRGIFLINSANQLVELRETPYDSESLLQGFLASYPKLLAGDEIDRAKPRRWLLISREAGVPGEQGGSGRWSADHLFLDQDGIPTLVEVKRSTDTRIRREVVGQMLDYAANAVVYWPAEHLFEQFTARCSASGVDPAQELAEFLGPEADSSEFWQTTKTNLQAGRVRMIFVADEIPPELRRIVEFLNQQMDPAEVLAVEIKQFVGEGLRTLVPSVIGRTAEAEQRKAASTTSRRQWDEATFFEEMGRRSSEVEMTVARRLLEWSRSQGLRIWCGSGQIDGSFVAVLDQAEYSHQLFAVLTTGKVELYFYWYATKPPFSDEGKRSELLRRLNEIPGMALPAHVISKRPQVPLTRLVAPSAFDQFTRVWEWFLSEVRSVQEG